MQFTNLYSQLIGTDKYHTDQAVALHKLLIGGLTSTPPVRISTGCNADYLQ